MQETHPDASRDAHKAAGRLSPLLFYMHVLAFLIFLILYALHGGKREETWNLSKFAILWHG